MNQLNPPDQPNGPSFRPSWHARSGRLTARKRWALEELSQRYEVAGQSRGPMKHAPIAFEIGAGTGEAALALARQRPHWLVVATEVHLASLASLLLGVQAAGLDNVAVAGTDGRAVLAELASQRRVELVRILFPDPWPKRRHHGRRLVEPGLLDLLAAALTPGPPDPEAHPAGTGAAGTVELATDDNSYAGVIARLFAADHRFVATAAGPARDSTYYEARAREAGRPVTSFAFRYLPQPRDWLRQPAPDPCPSPAMCSQERR